MFRNSPTVKSFTHFLVLCLIYRQVSSAPVDQATMNYLLKYGYVETERPGSGPSADTDLQAAIRALQYMGQVPQTGVMDQATVNLLTTPRCSIPDNVGFGLAARKRKRRYAAEGSKWQKLALTYAYKNYTQKLSQDVLRSVMSRAFQYWASVTPLTFREGSNPGADILLQYAGYDHGDGYSFDGPGGVLAHAFFPDSGGQAHFDESESWTDGVYTGINLLQVATHELGHALGLAHSGEPGAIMAPYYQGYNPNLQLGTDDIAGIQYLYGAPVAATTTRTTTTTMTTTTTTTTPRPTIKVAAETVRPTPPAIPTTAEPTTTTTPRTTTTTTLRPTALMPSINICVNSTIDAIVVISQTTYVFKDIYYYILDDYGILNGYPQYITSRWPEIQGKVDTVLYYDPVIQTDRYGNRRQIDTGHVFFFQGDKYWKYDGINRLNNATSFPRLISLGFPGLPSNLDSTFIWTGNGRVYATKGNQYYRYTKDVGTDVGYPRQLSVWTGVPSSGISTAFGWTNGRTYFFVNSTYYRFNDIAFKVDEGYPRKTGIWWFGCPVISGDLQEDPSLQAEYNDGGSQFKVVPNGNHNNGELRAYSTFQLHIFWLLACISFMFGSLPITTF